MSDDNGDEWSTPVWMADKARCVLGRIDCDPASNEPAQAIIQAGTYYTIDDDGLAQTWRGNVWLNPPYSKPYAWVNKLIESYEAGSVTAALLLVNSVNSPRWARRLWHSDYTVCLLDDRVRFWRIDRPGAKSTRHDQMIWYLGRHVARFHEAFAEHGSIRRAYQLHGTPCAICGHPFTARRADTLYCGAACRQKAKRRRVLSG